jgi:hypothetical protein
VESGGIKNDERFSNTSKKILENFRILKKSQL